MTLYLEIHVPGAEPHRIDELTSLEEAIEYEAKTVAEDAGSDLINDPGTEARDELKQYIIDGATQALRRPGDTYLEPAPRGQTGTLWSLVEREES